MSGSTSAGRTLRSKKSETGLFGNSNSVSSRFDQSVPPVPQTSAAEPKAKRKLTLFGKRRKSGSAISSSSSPTSRPSCDSSEMVRKSGEAARASFKAVHDFVNGSVSPYCDGSFVHIPGVQPFCHRPLRVLFPTSPFQTTASRCLSTFSGLL
jgi:hypothetical protein